MKKAELQIKMTGYYKKKSCGILRKYVLYLK